MNKKLSESMLEKLLDYYGNFVHNPRICGMVDAAGDAAGFSKQELLDDDLCDVAAAGDINQNHLLRVDKDISGK
ncbi:hypothetical protein AGMMS50212_08220 [Spirochaetia bacterium]|nr:hypothetical protein AGMMS50212_08220 [Spirochaetia bacterium]